MENLGSLPLSPPLHPAHMGGDESHPQAALLLFCPYFMALYMRVHLANRVTQP